MCIPEGPGSSVQLSTCRPAAPELSRANTGKGLQTAEAEVLYRNGRKSWYRKKPSRPGRLDANRTKLQKVAACVSERTALAVIRETA